MVSIGPSFLGPRACVVSSSVLLSLLLPFLFSQKCTRPRVNLRGRCGGGCSSSSRVRWQVTPGGQTLGGIPGGAAIAAEQRPPVWFARRRQRDRRRRRRRRFIAATLAAGGPCPIARFVAITEYELVYRHPFVRPRGATGGGGRGTAGKGRTLWNCKRASPPPARARNRLLRRA